MTVATVASEDARSGAVEEEGAVTVETVMEVVVGATGEAARNEASAVPLTIKPRPLNHCGLIRFAVSPL